MSVYNGEKYLVEAIESILIQTYKNFEFIIVNDGSKDNSVEIIKNYMKKDNRIVLIDRENKGLPYSLNEGISIAKGQYIARMDADDISLSNRFEKQIKYMEENKIDVCGSYIKLFGDNTKEQIVKYSIYHDDIKFRLLFMSSLAHPTVIFKKKVFEKVEYRVDYKVAQDYQLWCDIVNANFKIGNIPEILLNYREHEAQASIEKFKRQHDTAHEISLNYAKSLGTNEIELHNIINKLKLNNNSECFRLLFNKIQLIGNNFNVSSWTRSIILKEVYKLVTPKSPIIYYIYLKYTKDMKKNFNEEFSMLLKSFLIMKRTSPIYQFLKKLKNKIRK